MVYWPVEQLLHGPLSCITIVENNSIFNTEYLYLLNELYLVKILFMNIFKRECLHFVNFRKYLNTVSELHFSPGFALWYFCRL